MASPVRMFANLSRPVQVLAVLLLLAGVVCAVGAWQGWLLAAVAAVGLVVLVAAVLSFTALLMLLRRHRAAGFGQDLIHDIGRKFESGLETFRTHDKSLYALPWYLLVGEPGAGKTEAIRHSNIGFPTGLNQPAQGRGGTVNMDWWFTKKAVLLDTAGRLMFEASDEWRSFLHLLKRHRPHTPLNGVVLAIPVTSLQTDDASTIAQKAAQISSQLEVVQRELDVRFPVYVLITKADKIGGFREFFHNLSHPAQQNQILGWSNPAPLDEPFDPELVEQHLDRVRNRLRRRRLALLMDPEPVDETAPRRLDQVDALFAFPNELVRIGSRLRLYLEAIFMPSEWTTKPLFLRGIYFTSAMSQGAALDMDLAEALGLDPANLPTQLRVFSRDRSYFLRDFFLDKCFPEGGLVTGAANVNRSIRLRQATLVGTALAVAGGLIAASAYAYNSMQKSVGQHAQLWETVATCQRVAASTSAAPADDPLRWLQLWNTSTGEYRGSAPLPGMVAMNLGTLHRWADELALRDVDVPWLFSWWDLAGGENLNQQRRQAQRGMFVHGVYQPLLQATLRKLQSPQPPGTASIAAAAVHALALLTTAHAAADNPAHGAYSPNVAAPLFRLALPPDVTAPPANLRVARALFAADAQPWPPPSGIDAKQIAAVLTGQLRQQASQVATQLRLLARAAEAVRVLASKEQSLLNLRQACTAAAEHDPLAQLASIHTRWREGEEQLDTAGRAMKQSLAAAAVATDGASGAPSLVERYDQLLQQQQGLEAQFQSAGSPAGNAAGGAAAAPAGDALGAAIASGRSSAQATIAAGINDLMGATDADSPDHVRPALAWLDANELSHGQWATRLDAYAAERQQMLERPAPAVGAWITATAPPPPMPAPPEPALPPGQINDEARGLLQAANRFAQAAAQEQVEQKVFATLPQSADAWAQLIAQRSLAAPPVDLPALPLAQSQPAGSVGSDGYSTPAACEVAGQWVRFRRGWAGVALAGDAQERFSAGARAFADYVLAYRDHWCGVAAPVTVGPLTWPQVVQAVHDPDLASAAAGALRARSTVARSALQQLADKLTAPETATAQPLLEAVSALGDDSATASQTIQIWRSVIPDAVTGVADARSHLLQLPPEQLQTLFAAPSPPTLQAVYWKSFSARCLAALVQQWKSVGVPPADNLQQLLTEFPIAPWKPGCQVLSIQQLTQVRDQLTNLPTSAAPASPDASADFPPAVRTDFQQLRGLASSDAQEAGVKEHASAVASLISNYLVPSRPIYVNLSVLPAATQDQLDADPSAQAGVQAGDGRSADLRKQFATVAFITRDTSGQSHSSQPQALSPDPAMGAQELANTQLAEADIAAASLRFVAVRGRGDATAELNGGRWWPLVALKQNALRRVPGKDRSWYVRVAVDDPASQRRYWFWMQLDSNVGLDPQRYW